MRVREEKSARSYTSRVKSGNGSNAGVYYIYIHTAAERISESLLRYLALTDTLVSTGCERERQRESEMRRGGKYIYAVR